MVIIRKRIHIFLTYLFRNDRQGLLCIQFVHIRFSVNFIYAIFGFVCNETNSFMLPLAVPIIIY